MLLTDTQARFVELEKQKAEVKKFFDELNEATEAVAAEIGVGNFFQDAEGTVYQIVVPDGRFVAYQHLGYKRTRRIDEKRGDLSLKDAEAAGFSVDRK